MFIDEARIQVKAGAGGNGCVSLHHEKHRPKGGPDGGDGGQGGNVILKVDGSLHTLIDFRYHRHFKAPKGRHGQGDNKHGAAGEDLIIKVPPGTVVKDEKSKVLADLTSLGEQVMVARGGQGGRGNARFTTSTRQTPTFAEKGEAGEERWINLELRLLADVGLIGYPNAGKSTLISRISAARPKIADYPFTTRVPNLGVVRVQEEESFVVADIPGLIEGAHKGVGLGTAFLKHVDRTAILVHVLDLAALEGRDPIDDFKVVKKELRLYSRRLATRPQLVVGNKLDLPTARDNLERVAKYFKEKGVTFVAISSATGEGIDKFLHLLESQFKEAIKTRPAPEKASAQFVKVGERAERFTVRPGGKGVFIVGGKAIERLVSMTDLNSDEAVAYLQSRFKQIGLEGRLLEEGAKKGDKIKIGQVEFDFLPG